MSNDWWKTFFDENYLLFWGAKGMFAHTKKEINFIVKNIPIRKSDLILDLCCGHGRHTIELVKRGYHVTGFDYSGYELELARKEAKRRNLNIEFKRGDARSFKFTQKFDVILNMFTAFGYGTDKENRKIIRSVSKNLKKGGKFFIDLFNLAWMWRNYEPRRHGKHKGLEVKIDRQFNFLTSVNSETRRIVKGKNKKTYKQTLRMYTLPELAQLLQAEGMKVTKYWGSFRGESYGLDSKRMMVLAKKL